MKDRFKFRFFDNVSKEMCYPTEYNGKAEYLERRYDLADMFRFKDFIPMQCTGLKDKNGKLIYEGDIVKLSGNDNPYMNNIIGVVKYSQEYAIFFINRPNNIAWYEFCEVNKKELKIIGNIYENKELLGEEK